MSVDPLAAVRTVLLNDTEVAALVATRVYGGEVPASAAQAMPQACVVLSPSGGGLIGRAYQNYGDTRIDTLCYGATLGQSWDVYLAVYSALKHLQRGAVGGVLLHWARTSSKGTLARDPVTQWPVTLASWQVLASEVAAT